MKHLAVSELAHQSAEAASAGVASGRALVSEAIARWAEGAPADAAAFLACHPELRAEKSLVLDLAYEEYCCRREAGEALDPDEFCERFPSYRASLRRILQAHQFLEESSPRSDEAAGRRPQVGDAVLGFVLRGELGRGAFAQVFLAAEPALGNRLVAVKIAHHGAAEAETLGRLRHPNIVRVHSVREDPATGLSAICMAYAGTATLCDVMDRAYAGPARPSAGRVILEAAADALAAAEDPAPPDPLLRAGTFIEGVVHLGAQLAHALAFAHALGIFHRDLKPSNVLVTPGGKPMLLDFNLAFDKQASEARLGGTLPYMAPEHLRATDVERGIDPSLVDARSDLFSLGVILYELLTGMHPFGRLPAKLEPAELRQELLRRQSAGPKPLRQVNPRVSRHLARVIEGCLAFAPEDRPQSAAELAAQLRGYLAPRRRWGRWLARQRWRLLGAALLTLAVGAGVASVASLRDPPHLEAARSGLVAYDQGKDDEAVAHFTRAIEAAPQNPWVWFARGRAYQRRATAMWIRGERQNTQLFQKAVDDFQRAAKLTSDGRLPVCEGVCHSFLNNHEQAIERYQAAIQSGFASAEVRNDLGYSYAERNTPDDLQQADAYLTQVIAQNPRLMAAYRNRAWAGFSRALLQAQQNRGLVGAALEPVLADIHHAIDLCSPCPDAAEVYADAARFHARAARENGGQFEAVLLYWRLAVVHGQDAARLRQNLVVHAGKPELGNSLTGQTSGTPRHTLRIIDPIPGIPVEPSFRP